MIVLFPPLKKGGRGDSLLTTQLHTSREKQIPRRTKRSLRNRSTQAPAPFFKEGEFYWSPRMLPLSPLPLLF
ncbi:hypothetical protein AB4084_10850, partial [Lysobacter sp. 2RAB21]